MAVAVDITTGPLGVPSIQRATDTSAQALDAMGLRRMAGQRREVFDIVVGAQRNGARDLSLREIQQRYEARHGKRIDVSIISARVHNLVAAGWLRRRDDVRRCDITGMAVHPVYVPEKQARLCP